MEQGRHLRRAEVTMVGEVIAPGHRGLRERGQEGAPHGLAALLDAPIDERPTQRGMLCLLSGLHADDPHDLRILRAFGATARDLGGETFAQATIEEGLTPDTEEVHGVAFEGFGQGCGPQRLPRVGARDREAQPRVLDLLDGSAVRANHQIRRSAEGQELQRELREGGDISAAP